MLSLFKNILGKIDHLKRKIALFQFNPFENDISKINNLEFNYKEFQEISSITALSISCNVADYLRRLSSGHIFCSLINNDGILMAYGWVNNSGKHYLGELDLMMKVTSNFSILYDFYTFEAFRGQGLYPYLLQCICTRDHKSKLIYAFTSNRQSCKGIVKANFKFLGTLSGLTKNNYIKMINK